MNNTRCCVLPKGRKTEENIIRVELNHKSYAAFQCQFEGKLPAIYPYEGENFYILHLPWPTPEERQQGQKAFEYEKKKAFTDMLQAGKTCFKYISVTDLKIENMDLKDKYLSFPGSWIWTLRIRNVKEIDTLDLSDTKLRGVNEISIGQINGLYIKNANIRSSLHFNECHVSNVFVEKSLFSDKHRSIYYRGGDDSGFHFINCNLEQINMFESEFQTTLRFNGTKFGALSMNKCKFYIVPCLLRANEISSVQKITFPARNDFIQMKKPKIKMSNFLKAIKNDIPLFQENGSLFHNFKTVLRRRKKEAESYSNFKEGEYNKFRAIHKLVKGNGWYAEQDDYNYLMRMTMEQINHTGFLNTIISKIYRWSSNYGQSAIQPFAWLIFFWVSFSIIYSLLDSTTYNSFQRYFHETLLPGAIFSLNQIIKPFQLILFDENSSLVKSLIGLFESIISSTLIAFILIALRWHFKRD